MTTRERRSATRKTCGLRTVLSLREGRRQFDAGACTRDISTRGAFLESAFILKVGTVLDVAIEIPGLDGMVRTRATVVRQQAPAIRDKGYSIPGNVGFAVKFHDPIKGRAAEALEACAAESVKTTKTKAKTKATKTKARTKATKTKARTKTTKTKARTKTTKTKARTKTTKTKAKTKATKTSL